MRLRFGRPSLAVLMLAAAPLPAPGPAAGPVTVGAGQCLTMASAIARAQTADPRAGRAGALAARALADAKTERGTALPQVQAFNRSGVGDGIRADNQFDNRVGLQLSQRVFDFGRGALRRHAADARSEAATFDTADARLTAADEAGRRLIAIASGEERAAAAGAIASYYEKDAALAGRRLDAGLLRSSEAAGVEAEYARARAVQADEALGVATQRAELGAIIGAVPPCVSAASIPEYLGAMPGLDPERAIAEARAAAPAIKAAEAAARAASIDARRLKREGLPDISIGATTAYDYGLTSLASNREYNRLGFNVSTPLFSGGSLRARVQAADADATAAAFAVGIARQQVEQDVGTAAERAARLQTIGRLQARALDAAKARADAIDREYAQGLVTLTELLEARRDEYDRRLAEIDARYQLMLARLTLKRLTGRIE